MSNELRHLQNQIKTFEDLMFREKDFNKQMQIREQIIPMRIKEQKMRFNEKA